MKPASNLFEPPGERHLSSCRGASHAQVVQECLAEAAATSPAQPYAPRNVGILGGTFDPIHIGHLLAAEAAREGAGLDEVWLLPANVPPHKADGSRTDPGHRWRMVCEAAAGNPHLRASDLELRMGGVSYTIDTVLLLK
ncbi:MAG: adenylyltransferase/cytidyltransferase family protein, partial [Roseiflexus sp.]|nr:adenylyltransferase/cytidyltransferase family protein [Roseiflexus sp.]